MTQRLLKTTLCLLLAALPLRGLADEPMRVPPPVLPVNATVSDLELHGDIDGENIIFTLTLKVDVRDKNATLPLVVGDVGYLDGKFPGKAELVRNGNIYVLKLQPGGGFGGGGSKQTVSFTFASRATVDGDWRRTSFSIPAASVRKLSVLCDRADLEVKLPGALDVKNEKTPDGKLKVTGFLGTADTFSASWKPEVRQFDSELVVACDANTLASASVGALRLDSIFTYRVIQGELSQLVIDLPNINVIQVNGEDIQDWQIDRSDVAHPKLKVSLGRPKEEVYRLRVESEMALPALPCKFDLPVLTPENVIRTSGFLMTGADSAIKLQVDKAVGLTQVDQAAFPVVNMGVEPEPKRLMPVRSTFAYQYASLPYTLSVEADDIVTSFTADDRLLVSMEDNDVTFTAAVQLEIKDAPAREIMIETDSDPGWTVTSITGQHVSEADSDVRAGPTNAPNQRLITVPFQEAVLGTVLVNIRMEKTLHGSETNFVAPQFKVVDAKSERGYLVTAAEKGLRLNATPSDGLRKVHTSSSGMQVPGAQEAYRFKEPGWTIAFTLDRAATSMHSEIFHLVSLGEGVMYYSAAITYHISGAPVQEFKIRVPAHIERIDLVGADIEGWTRDGDICTVKLQTRVMGDYTLLATYDSQFTEGAVKLDMGEIQTENTETELGYIAVASAASLKITEDSALPDSIIKIDRSEIPVAYSSPVNHPILRAYKYVKRPHVASVNIVPYETERLLGQVVDYVRLSTVLSRDGETVTTATYFIKNAERQYLVAALPAGAKLWSINYVHDDGTKEPVISQNGDHGLLIPVNRPKNPDTAIPVEIVYAESHGALGFWRSGVRGLTLVAPSLPETHATFASWQLNVPESFAIGSVGGNVTAPATSQSGSFVKTLKVITGLCHAIFDGPGNRTIGGALFGELAGGHDVVFTRSVNLSSAEPVTLKLSIVPDWMGNDSSPRIMLGALILAVVLIVRSRREASVVLQSLFITLVVLAVAQTAYGRALLATVGLAVIVFGVIVLVVKRKPFAWLGKRLARRRNAWDPDKDCPPFEPVAGSTPPPDEKGFVSMKCLFLVLAASLLGLSAFAKSTYEPPPVMDGVTISIHAPGTAKEGEKSAAVTATLEFKAAAPVIFMVLPTSSVLTGYELNSRDLDIVNTPDGYGLHVKRAGNYKIALNYQAPVVMKEGSWQLAVGMPVNMKNKIELLIPEKGVDVSSDSAVLLRTTETNDMTRAEAVFGPTMLAHFSWQPRARRTTLEKTVFFCEVNSFVGLQPGVIELTNLIRYQISQGEVRELKVRIPTNVSVTAVSAPTLATWSFEPKTRLLDAVLERPVNKDFTLTLVTQIASEGLPYTSHIESVEVLDASRQRGSLAVAAPDSMQVRIDNTEGLSPMNIQDFPTEVAALATNQATVARLMTIRKAFRYSEPKEVSVVVNTEQVLSEIRVSENASLSIADERVVLATALDLSIAKAGIFSVKLMTPTDFEVETLTGPDVSHWDESKEEPGAVIVHFNKQVEGVTTVNLTMARTEKGVEPTMSVPRIVVTDATKHTGRLTVSSERGVRLMVENQTGVDIKKASELGIKQAGILVFDILRPGWSIQLRSEVLAPVVKPKTLQVVDLAEGILQCDTHIHLDIENAGIKSVRLKAPAPGVTLSTSGSKIAGIAETDKEQGIWQVDLHSKVEDACDLVVSYQMAYDPADKQVKILPVQVLDTEEQRGYVVIKSGGRVQVEPTGDLTGLKVEDPRTIPNLFAAGDLSGAVYCYRALRPDYTLALSVVRHDAASVLPANISKVRMTSTLSSSGKLLTRVQLDMTVGSLRLLRLALPHPDDQLWTVFVNGSEVATSRDGALYGIPLEEQLDAESTHIELIYAEAALGGLAGRKRYDAPKFSGLPLNDIEWTFYVPPQFTYSSFKGTVQWVEGAYHDVEHFNADHYRAQNAIQTEENKKRAEQDLDIGNSLLKAGKPNVAKKVLLEAVNYSQGQSDLNEDARVQLRSLQKQQLKIGLLNRRDAVRSLNNIVSDEPVAQMEGFKEGNYSQEYAQQAEQRLTEKDNDAFEVLTDKMLDQQAAAAGVTTGIRITMPEDGLALRFTRALQIDPDGALYVSFRASSGWWQSALAVVGPALICFVGLWFVLAARAQRRGV